MKPLKLTMQAFGSYGKATLIDFTKTNQNIFLISGDTGAGKTTIFDAIVFALYGEASSNVNKKDGLELQSQFMDTSVEPFVELEFMEKRGEKEENYIVKRVPRHKRIKKKGTGDTEESEKVSLTLPDGTVYPQKETDKKLEEIVGLTKEQFMQVTMIAQGEFMELLRAKSDEKKVIFRKLFHTELFKDVVEELAKRKKEKLSEITTIRTACQTEVSHILIPENDTEKEKLQMLKERILNSQKLSVTDMEELLEELKVLCDEKKELYEAIDCEYQKTSLLQKEARDALTNGRNLIQFFEQKENAVQQLAECVAQEEEIREDSDKIIKIETAYDIQVLYDRYTDVLKLTEEYEKQLEKQQQNLPDLKQQYQLAVKDEERGRSTQEQELADYTRILEKVKKDLESLKKIEELGKQILKKENEHFQIEEKILQKKSQVEQSDSGLEEWKKEADTLEDTSKLFALWQIKLEEMQNMEEELFLIQKVLEECEKQKEVVKKWQDKFEEASRAYETANQEYETVRRIYLNAQAGFLAREKLKEGEPCPVCGSVEHPNPCRLEEEQKEITSQTIENLKEETQRFKARQEQMALESQKAMGVYKEKETQANLLTEKFMIQALKYRFAGKEDEFEKVREKFKHFKESIKEEGKVLNKKVQRKELLQKNIRQMEENKKRWIQELEQEKEQAVVLKTATEKNKAVLAQMKQSLEYSDKTMAEHVLSEAKQRYDEKEKSYARIKEWLQQKKKELDHAEALICRYQKELPEKRQEQQLRWKEYEEKISATGFCDLEWKKIVETYEKTVITELREKVEKYKTKKITAENLKEAAGKAIGQQECPDLEKLQLQQKAIEEKVKQLQKRLEEEKEYYKTNRDVFGRLQPKMEERKRILSEYTRLDGLYGRLSGKVSGGRMDIETFVQRYYLERILYNANKRFFTMSAGQFELRLCDMEQAGEGKNRGLDFMVYSMVTGKTREVRTLSGGESFMAALSLALGLADRIQESQAGINLDIMFIDEGFGSLDEHSRNQAVRILREIAGGSKFIGMISHVTELKQEIENQLIVFRDETGSHVKWQIS